MRRACSLNTFDTMDYGYLNAIRLLRTFGDSGSPKQNCHDRSEGGKLETPCESLEKRAIFSRSVGPSAGVHQKRHAD
jgi:hypothetical protein